MYRHGHEDKAWLLGCISSLIPFPARCQFLRTVSIQSVPRARGCPSGRGAARDFECGFVRVAFGSGVVGADV